LRPDYRELPADLDEPSTVGQPLARGCLLEADAFDQGLGAGGHHCRARPVVHRKAGGAPRLSGRCSRYRSSSIVDYPARLAQQFGDLAIAVAAVLPGKRDNVGRQTLLVVTTARDLALCRAVLPERRTGATLGDMQLRSDLLNADTAMRGA
jgi:hypothetical protein